MTVNGASKLQPQQQHRADAGGSRQHQHHPISEELGGRNQHAGIQDLEPDASPCAVTLNKYCGTAAKGAACIACEHQHSVETKAAHCDSSKMSRFCQGPAPPTPPTPPGPLPGPVWAPDLPPLTQAQYAKCRAAAIVSTDDGKTWSVPKLMQVNGSLNGSAHYAGFGLNHGIELQNGPHAGRLALARRFDCPAVMGDHNEQGYFHSYVLYSDDQGESWTVGQLLPQGWTECQVAELKNGSLLMTSRMYGKPWLSSPPKPSDLRRGFARSDDGGRTWAEIWYLEQRQPEIMTGTCAQALVSDPAATSTIFYAHPGNYTDGTELARANYTLHASDDGGASWQLINRVYPLGAGYSDAHVLPDPAAKNGLTLAMVFQKTFEPPVPSIEGGGYDMGLALLEL